MLIQLRVRLDRGEGVEVHAEFGPQFRNDWVSVDRRTALGRKEYIVEVNWSALGAGTIAVAEKFNQCHSEAIAFATRLVTLTPQDVAVLGRESADLEKEERQWIEYINKEDPDGRTNLWREWAK